MEYVRIAILNNNDVVLGYMDNKNENALHYYDEELHTYLTGSAYTFSFSTLSNQNEDNNFLIVGNKLSFSFKDKHYYCNIVNVENDGTRTKVISYGLSFELTNEEVGAYKADRAMSFEEYLTAFNFERNVLTIGVNEVSDKRITYEWEGTQTVLARLFSLATVFSAELEFIPHLNNDYSLNSIVMNIYQEHDNDVQGMGKDRRSEVIRYGYAIKNITKTSDITDIYTAIRPTGKDGLTLAGISRTEYDEYGNVEYTSPLGTIEILAPLARDRFPSNLTYGINDRYIAKVYSYETDNVNTLYGQALAQLKKNCVPQVSYKVDGYIDGNIGDTFTIEDTDYKPTLYLEARITEQVISFSDDTKNKTTFDNFVEVQSQISDALIAQMNALIEANKLYLSTIISDNGTVLKKVEDETTLTANVMDGALDITDNFIIKWYKDNVELDTSKKQITVLGSDIVNQRSSYRFEAINATQAIKGTYEVTVALVEDGTKGEDGKTSYLHIAYANSADGKTDFSTSVSLNKLYIGTYTDFNEIGSNDPSLYKWTLTKGEPGEKGEQGEPGESGKTLYTWIKYADTPTSGMSDDPDGKVYIGIAVDKETPTPSDRYEDYNWSLLKGADGLEATDFIEQFYLSTSKDTPTGGVWSDIQPTYVEGKFYWCRLKTTWKDGSVTYSEPFLIETFNYSLEQINEVQDNLDLTKLDLETEISAVQETADGKNTVFYQTTAPATAGRKTNDIWYDTDDSNRMYVFNGSSWVAVQFGVNAIANDAITADKIADAVNTQIANAQTDATKGINDASTALAAANNAQSTANTAVTNASTALTTANGKNTVFYQATAPSVTGRKVNDVWFDTDDSNRMYYFNGTSWTARQFGTNAIANASITNALIADASITNAKISNLDAGKITTGTLLADRIGARTIAASKLIANTITASSGVIANAAITTAMIASLAVGSAQIADSAITNAKIANLAVTNAKIADLSVTNAKIADATIQNAKIANLDAAKITTGYLSADRIASNSLVIGKLDSSTQNLINYSQLMAMGFASGKLIYRDCNFNEGINSVGTYNNLNNGNVTTMRVAAPAGCPNTGGYCMRVRSVGNASPVYGGFVQSLRSRAGAHFLVKYIINLPVGYELRLATNQMGTGYIDRWLTSNQGTGKYTEYVREVICGTTGTFSSGGHVAMYTNGSGTAPTTSSPLDMYISYIGAFDITEMEYDSYSILGKLCYDANMTYINGGKIYTGTVTTDKLAANSVTAAKIAAGTITATQIASSAITTDKIAANAITAAKIAAGTITATQIASSAITTDKIAANAITSAKIYTGAITADKIASSAITADKISANAITSAKLATDAIKSRNYVANSAGSYLNLATGAFDSKNLKWDSAGNITATSGTIGGITLSSTQLSASSTSGSTTKSYSITNDGVIQSSMVQGSISHNTYLASGMLVLDERINGGANRGINISGDCINFYTGDSQSVAAFSITDGYVIFQNGQNEQPIFGAVTTVNVAI